MVLAERVPLVQEEDGGLRVEGTRVYLEDVAEAFRTGLSAEETARAFSLELADV